MKRAAILGAVVFTLALPALATPAAPVADCEQLQAEIARVEQARRKAADDSDNAWKAVVPFVVLARKASAKGAVGDADKRLAELKAQATQRCPVPGDAQ
jgi:uncharacterized MAPEG superfamily protein